MNVNKNMHVVLGRQLKEAKAILAQEDVPIDFSPPCTQELPEENVPEVVLITALGVRKCHGCKLQTIRTNCSPQKIWFFTCRLFEYGSKIHKVKPVTNVMAMFIFT